MVPSVRDASLALYSAYYLNPRLGKNLIKLKSLL